MLNDAFKQAVDINRETSFEEAATGRYNDQIGTKIETQINELEDSFQEYDINAMSTRSKNRSGDRSWNRSFDRSSHKNNSFNSSQNSRSNYRGNSYYNNNDSQNRQGSSRDNSRNREYQQQLRYEQRNQNYQNRLTTIKIEIGLTTEGDQININTTEINTKHRSSLNSQIKT